MTNTIPLDSVAFTVTDSGDMLCVMVLWGYIMVNGDGSDATTWQLRTGGGGLATTLAVRREGVGEST